MAKSTKSAPKGNGKKTVCPISLEQFRRAARPLAVTVDGQMMTATVKEFATGSIGWNISGKVTVLVDGVPCSVQVGANLILVGSKPSESNGDGEE